MNTDEAIQRLTEVIRRKHLALATERSYCAWLRQYCDYLKGLPSHLSSEQKLEHFLTRMAKKDVAASTQNQAFNGQAALIRRKDLQMNDLRMFLITCFGGRVQANRSRQAKGATPSETAWDSMNRFHDPFRDLTGNAGARGYGYPPPARDSGLTRFDQPRPGHFPVPGSATSLSAEVTSRRRIPVANETFPLEQSAPIQAGSPLTSLTSLDDPLAARPTRETTSSGLTRFD